MRRGGKKEKESMMPSLVATTSTLARTTCVSTHDVRTKRCTWCTWYFIKEINSIFWKDKHFIWDQSASKDTFFQIISYIFILTLYIREVVRNKRCSNFRIINPPLSTRRLARKPVNCKIQTNNWWVDREICIVYLYVVPYLISILDLIYWSTLNSI